MTKALVFMGIIAVVLVGVLLFFEGTSPAQEEVQSLQIILPADGTVMAPGETFTAIVELAPGITFPNGVGIEGSLLIGPLFAPPFEFPLTIPSDTQVGTIIKLIAVGSTVPGIFIESLPSIIHIERPDSPTELKVTPRQIIFETGEEHSPLHVSGRFADGVLKTINGSTLTTYTSSDSTVAVADKEGITAVGHGTAIITIGYRDKSIEVQVSVPETTSTIPGDFNSDGCVDRADYRILIADIRNRTPNNPTYDLNGDGVVNRADGRTLFGLFTNPRGAPCS